MIRRMSRKTAAPLSGSNHPMPRRRRPRRKHPILRRALLVLLAIPALYLIAALLGGLVSVNRSWTEPPGGVTVYLADNGVHADLILPVRAQGLDWRAVLSPGDARRPPDAPAFVAFGSGERAVYLDTPTWADLKPKTALVALARGRRIMHVDWMADDGFAVREMRLRPEEYRRLFQAVRESFNGRPRLIPGRGYGDTDAFYESDGHTSAFWTCNQWVASRLRLAGVRAPLWSPFPTALTRRYRAVARGAR